MTDEEAESVTWTKAPLSVFEWQVKCPCCENAIIVDACENNDGSFHADGPDQFIVCDECGCHIEVTPVQIMDFPT